MKASPRTWRLGSLLLLGTLALIGVSDPVAAEEDDGPSRPVPASYARFEGVKIDSPDTCFFTPLRPEPDEARLSKDREARTFRYALAPGATDHYLVVVAGDKKAKTPFGEQVVKHRMEVLLAYSVEKLADDVARVRQTVHDFYVTARRPLPSPGGGARDILIRKRWHGDLVKVWSGDELLADNEGGGDDPQGLQVVRHLTSEIDRMTEDITFGMDARGTTKDLEGPVEFVALFDHDFGCPLGIVLPDKAAKPGDVFVRKERSPVTELTVSGQCRDDLETAPVEKTFTTTYLGDTKVGRYDCAVFHEVQKDTYEDLVSSRKTPHGTFPVRIETVTVERERRICFAPELGKVIAYEARHRTVSSFAVQTPMGDRAFETDARTRWTLILHDALTFEPPAVDTHEPSN